MDNFRKPKRTFKRPHAVDGFVASKPAGTMRKQFASNYQPVPKKAPQTQVTSLDNFKRSDGFSAASVPAPIDTKAPLEDPTRKSRRNNKNGPQRSKFKRVLRVCFILLIVSVLAVGGYAGYAYLKSRQVFKGGGGSLALEKNVDPVKLKGEGDGRINIVMLGIGGEGHDGPYLTDTILVASIDPIQNETVLLSIPRDLWVQQDSGGATKINAVYAYARDAALAKSKDKDAATKAAAAATEKTLTSVLGIPINYFVVVDFSGFEQAVDTVGGLDLNVTTDTSVTDYMYNEATGKNYTLSVQPGAQHFDGLRALMYSRSRHTSARGDFDRAARQRLLLEAFKTKVQSAGTYANPIKVTQLLSNFGDHVRTDMTIGEMMRLYDIGKNIAPDKIASMSLVDPPNVLLKTGQIGGLSVVLPIEGEFEYSNIQSFVRNNVKDAFLKNENANITILNGTSIGGLAGKRSAELKSFGYNVGVVADAPTKTYTKTVIVDLTKGAKKYTKSYLEKRFGVTSVTSIPDAAIQPGTADFVILLGTDAATTPATTP